MSKKATPKRLIIPIILLVVTVMVIVGQFSDILSPIALRLPEAQYEEVFSTLPDDTKGCLIGYSKGGVLRGDAKGWPVWQETIGTNKNLPECVGSEMKSEIAYIINTGILVMTLGVMAFFAIKNLIKHKKIV